MPMLQVLQGPDRGKRFELPNDEPQLIGRSSEALPITDTTVSRRHAELTPDDGAWWLRDLDSANGTFLNGARIDHRTELAPGDQVRCGSTLFIFGVTQVTDDRPSVISMLPSDVFEATVESTADNEDSMILASPDPVRAATDHLRVIYQLTALTASTFEPEELLGKVMDLIFEEFQPDRGFILLMEGPESPPKPVVVRYQTRPRTLDEGRIPVSRTIIEHTLTKGEGVLSTNAMNDQRFEAGDSVQDYGIRSAVCVPIAAADRTFGVINIDSQMPNFTFTDLQLRLLTAIGQHTGLFLLSAEHVKKQLHTERLAAMGETVATLSHAIKNILQGLRSGADAVALSINRGDLDLAREGWPILSRNLDRTLALTLNMLAWSKQRSLDIELAPLDALVRDAVELIQPQCDRRRIGLIVDLDESAPPVPHDVDAMHQALMNLLTNAVEAAPAKTGVITISTTYDAQTHTASISVADNGAGVPIEARDKIFDAFFTTKGQRGTGLGLAVTQKIAEEHGGRIDVVSTPEQGATFTIVLPTDRDTMSSADTRQPRPRPVTPEAFE